jgi:hypothetical protein
MTMRKPDKKPKPAPADSGTHDDDYSLRELLEMSIRADRERDAQDERERRLRAVLREVRQRPAKYQIN